MFLNILSEFQVPQKGRKGGSLEEKKHHFHKTRKTAKTPGSGRLLFLALAAFFFWGVSPAIAEITSDGEALVQEFTELCRWRSDVATFTALHDIRKNGGLDIPRTIDLEACAKEKQAKHAAARKEERQVDSNLADEIRTLVAGHPIENMAEAIARYNREVAALIVGIAKKESNWGKRVPLDKNGDDCFNYWGFKGAGARGIAMGHGCFGTPEEAVEKIGNRLEELVELRQSSEPARMIIWKCGSSCATHTPESVQSWISAVNLYYRQIARP